MKTFHLIKERETARVALIVKRTAQVIEPVSDKQSYRRGNKDTLNAHPCRVSSDHFHYHNLSIDNTHFQEKKSQKLFEHLNVPNIITFKINSTKWKILTK